MYTRPIAWYQNHGISCVSTYSRSDLWAKRLTHYQEFSQCPFAPPGVFKATAELAVMHNEIKRDLYSDAKEPADLGSLSTSYSARLTTWWNELPIYIKPECPVAPCHLRAVTYIGLRYHHLVLLVTRMDLLRAATHNHDDSAEFQRKVDLCESSNEEAIRLLQKLDTENLICRRNFFDAFHILNNGMTLLLRCLGRPTGQAAVQLERFLPLLAHTDHLAIGQFGRRSYEALIRTIREDSR